MRHGSGGRWLVGGLLLSAALAGCSSSKTETAPPTPKASKPVDKPAVGPETIVSQFLEAIRTGNDEQAAGLLTNLAREKTAEMDMAIAPPGNDTATFTVGEVEMLPGDIAHVASRWVDGEEQHDIVWALRREPEGWRIGGMVTKPFPDEELPLVLNFEDPEDMILKQEMVEQEMARRAQQEILQAEKPADVTTPLE